MKVLLVYPTLGRVHADPPLGLAYLASFLREKNIDVKIYDTSWDQSEKGALHAVKQYQPDLLGITSNTINYNNSLKIAKACKNYNKNITVCLGGPHPTALPQETLHSEFVDFVILGEGELSFTDLVFALKNSRPIKKIDGLGYKDNGAPKINSKIRFIMDLDQVPFPARDLLPMKRYLKVTPPMPLPIPSTSMMTSRGCPFNCFFCQPLLRNLFGNKVRRRSAKNVVDEIEYLISEYKIKSIDFQDDTMGYDKNWLKDFRDELIKRGIEVKWRCENRVTCASTEILKLMKESGCINMVFGVESGSKDMLKILRKLATPQQAIAAFKNCAEVGITTRANFMIGTPGETKETLLDSLNIIKKLDPEMIMTHITTPMVGSDLYTSAKEAGIVGNPDFSSFSRHNVNALKLDNFSPTDLKKYIWRFRIRFLTNLFPLWLMRKRYFLNLAIRRWLSLWEVKGAKSSLKTLLEEVIRIPFGYW